MSSHLIVLYSTYVHACICTYIHMYVTYYIRTCVMLQREARSHFGCDTLEGAQLENQGGTATARSHWEKRLFQV